MLIWLITLCYDKARARKVQAQAQAKAQVQTRPKAPEPPTPDQAAPRPPQQTPTATIARQELASPPSPVLDTPLKRDTIALAESPKKGQGRPAKRERGKIEVGESEVFERGEYRRLE
jgi:hypothetical protein